MLSTLALRHNRQSCNLGGDAGVLASFLQHISGLPYEHTLQLAWHNQIAHTVALAVQTGIAQRLSYTHNCVYCLSFVYTL